MAVGRTIGQCEKDVLGTARPRIDLSQLVNAGLGKSLHPRIQSPGLARPERLDGGRGVYLCKWYVVQSGVHGGQLEWLRLYRLGGGVAFLRCFAIFCRLEKACDRHLDDIDLFLIVALAHLIKLSGCSLWRLA